MRQADDQAGLCVVAGCMRPTWNGKPGEQCCRTCGVNSGRFHGDDCNRKAAEAMSQAAPEYRPCTLCRRPASHGFSACCRTCEASQGKSHGPKCEAANAARGALPEAEAAGRANEEAGRRLIEAEGVAERARQEKEEADRQRVTEEAEAARRDKEEARRQQIEADEAAERARQEREEADRQRVTEEAEAAHRDKEEAGRRQIEADEAAERARQEREEDDRQRDPEEEPPAQQQMRSGSGAASSRRPLSPRPLCCSCMRISGESPESLREGKESLENQEWQLKARELAHRGIALETLLDFYAELPTLMPHFDAKKSTTSDVVRQAIIPKTWSGRRGEDGVALASMLEKDSLPTRLVCHTWSNLFANTMAAMVAEALGERCYLSIVDRMSNDNLVDLKNELSSKRALSMRFWFCAVSVNQHANICGGYAPQPDRKHMAAYKDWDTKRKDTVTCKLHPKCRCKTGKHFHAAGAKCEINKFDDMMRFMSDQSEPMCLVFVVDPDFVAFSRIWCMAELVQSSRMQIKIKVKMPSHVFNEEHKAALKSIKIEKCTATRDKDLTDVLQRIRKEAADGDRAIEALNEELQNVLFGDTIGIGGVMTEWMEDSQAGDGTGIQKAQAKGDQVENARVSLQAALSEKARSGQLTNILRARGPARGLDKEMRPASPADIGVKVPLITGPANKDGAKDEQVRLVVGNHLITKARTTQLRSILIARFPLNSQKAQAKGDQVEKVRVSLQAALSEKARSGQLTNILSARGPARGQDKEVRPASPADIGVRVPLITGPSNKDGAKDEQVRLAVGSSLLAKARTNQLRSILIARFPSN